MDFSTISLELVGAVVRLFCCSVDEDHREDWQVPNRLFAASLRLCNPITVPYFLPQNALVSSHLFFLGGFLYP